MQLIYLRKNHYCPTIMIWNVLPRYHRIILIGGIAIITNPFMFHIMMSYLMWLQYIYETNSFVFYIMMSYFGWHGLHRIAPNWTKRMKLSIGWSILRLNAQCSITLRPLLQNGKKWFAGLTSVERVHAIKDGTFIIETPTESGKSLMHRISNLDNPPPCMPSTVEFLVPVIKLVNGHNIDIADDMRKYNFYICGNILFDTNFLKWFVTRFHALSLDVEHLIECGKYNIEFIDHTMTPQSLNADSYVTITSDSYKIHSLDSNQNDNSDDMIKNKKDTESLL